MKKKITIAVVILVIIAIGAATGYHFYSKRFIYNKEEESAIFLEVYHLCLEAVLASMGVVLFNNVLL